MPIMDHNNPSSLSHNPSTDPLFLHAPAPHLQIPWFHPITPCPVLYDLHQRYLTCLSIFSFFNIEGPDPKRHISLLSRDATWPELCQHFFFKIKQHLQFLISPFSSLLAFGEINLPSFYPLVYLWIQISHPILQAIVYEINKVGQ